MASKLSPCKMCNHEVSLSARTCPQCGEKNPCKRPSKIVRGFVWFLGGMMLLGLLQGIMLGPSAPNAVSSSAGGYSESASREACERAIMASVNNPSTVDIQRIVGYGTDVLGNGTRRITQTFSAKNGFGLETTYDAYCTISPAGELDIRIVEQGR
ncbi:MAG: hypothetical protein H6862_01580 [Rhodospirillales bacterium]|nr:hypothetical protein [Rhodospirillales bacterium]